MAMSFQSYINAPGLIISGLAATNRDISLYSGSSLRWVIRGTNSAESGTDTGTDFTIIARTDAGSPIDSPLNIVRASAGQITIGGTSARLSVFTGAVHVTTTLKLLALSTGTLINTAGVVSALSGTNLVLGDGSTIAQSTFALASSISGTTGQVTRFSGTNTITSDGGFYTQQTSGITRRILLDGSVSTATNTEMVLVGRNSTGGQTDLSWSTGVGGTPIRRMTARWNDTADQLEFFSSDDAGSARATRIAIPRTTATAMLLNGYTSIAGRLDTSGGIYVTQNAQEALTLTRSSSTVTITHGIDFSAWNNSSSTVVYSKIRNSIVTSVAGSESSALFFYTKNNSVENKNFAIYKDYVTLGSVPLYQNDGGRVLIDATGKGIFTALTSAGTITFSAFTSAGFVKTNASGVLSVDTATYIPYSGTLGISNLGANGISGWGYVVSSGTVISDGRGVNWRGGLVSNDSYFGIGQDATTGTDFKPFVIGGGTSNSVWFKIDPLASVKTTITGGLSLANLTTGVVSSNSGVISNVTNPLANGYLLSSTTAGVLSWVPPVSKTSHSFTFTNEQHHASITVTDSSVSATSMFIIQHDEEDLHIQSVSFYATNINPGVGYDIIGIAPNGASGIYTINSVKVIA